MRSEQEMLELIIDIARRDERIRAVVMNGSRANPNAPRDVFQDFDIVYLVTDVVPFKKNLGWIKHFGELMILQIPEDMQDPPPSDDGGFSYLMQFADGNRIDLGIYPLADPGKCLNESLIRILLDKDGVIRTLPPASEADYLPKTPTEKEFADCCNEFWWVCPYVAKGLWRREILYARYMFDQSLRAELMKMLNWYIGIKTNFSQNPGKYGKYFQRHLEAELWEMLLSTYTDASYENTWDALFRMGDMFRAVALYVANHFDFVYPHNEDRNVTEHLLHVRILPEDATQLY